jgi:hypothetical protein
MIQRLEKKSHRDQTCLRAVLISIAILALASQLVFAQA